MNIDQIMRTKVVTIGPDQTAGDAYLLMRKNEIRHLPILKQGMVVGVLSDRDLRLVAEQPEVKVEEICHRRVVYASPETDIREAAKIMVDLKIGCLPILDSEGNLKGMVTKSDLLSAFVEFLGLITPSDYVSIELQNSRDQLDHVISDLKRDGAKVLGITMSEGRPKSGKREYSFRVQTTDLIALKNKLGSRGYHLIAH